MSYQLSAISCQIKPAAKGRGTELFFHRVKWLGEKTRDYSQLMKLRLSLLVVFSSLIGFWVLSDKPLNVSLFEKMAVGLFLVVAGANAANEIIEKDADALMARTAVRPLPSGRMTLMEAAISSFLMTISGFSILLSVDRLTFFLGLLAYAIYVFLYTPLKKITPWCVFVGAFPGAIPAMMGPAALQHAITPVAWLFFGIVFLWQFPHFCAIAWVAREDYGKAGFKVLACPKNVRFTAYEILLFSCALLGVSPLLAFQSHVGSYYFIGSFLLGLFLVSCAMLFWMKPSEAVARRVMGMALLYLPSLFLLMILDQVPSW